MTARPFARRCPACGVERPASEFRRAGGASNVWTSRRVVCPACGHVAERSEFVVVEPPAREPPAGRTICRSVRKDGAPCKQVALSGSGLCRWHRSAEPRGMS